MSGDPEVSVVLIYLDEERFLPEAVDGVVAQSYENWELLLVDDGSTDGSSLYAREMEARHSPRIRYLEHPGHGNRGMSASRSLGIAHSRGRYVAFLDGDDVWMERKLEHHVDLMRQHPEVDLIYGATLHWHSWPGSKSDEQDWVEPPGFTVLQVVPPPDHLVATLTGAGFPTSSEIVFRRSLVEKAGGPEDCFHDLYEDLVFLTKAFLSSPVLVADGCLSRYRQHPDSCCAWAERSGAYGQGLDVYLDWLENHLLAEGVENRSVWQAYRQARKRRSISGEEE